MSGLASMEGGGNFVVHCGECGHTWTAAILPMSVDDFARLARRAACPRGCRAKVLCGTALPRDPAASKRKGGLARAASMTPEQRSAVARKAANKRWHGSEESGE